jgi:hypothetical protein
MRRMTRCANNGLIALQQIASLFDHLVGAAEQKIGFHRAFTFDVDAAVRLEPKVLMEVLMGCCRDLDTIR